MASVNCTLEPWLFFCHAMDTRHDERKGKTAKHLVNRPNPQLQHTIERHCNKIINGIK